MFEGLFILTTIFVIYIIWNLLSIEKSKRYIYDKLSENKDKQKSDENQKKLNIHTHYDNLKVTRDAPASVIKAAYKALIQNYHSDKFEGSEEEALRIAKLIKRSYDVLIDPISREKHDRWMDEQEQHKQHSSTSYSEKSENIAKIHTRKYHVGIWSIVIVGFLLFYGFGVNSVGTNWYFYLISSALPFALFWYALGTLVTYKIKLTKSLKIAGFFMAWLFTAILALLMAKESSAASAGHEIIHSSFIAVLITIFLTRKVGQLEAG